MTNSLFSRWIDRTQFGGLLLLTLAVPLVFYVRNQNIVLLKPLITEFVVFALFGLWLIEALERGRFRLPHSPLNRPIVLYFLWALLTVFLSSHFWFYSLEELARYLAVFLLFFLVLKTVRSATRLKWLLWVLVAVTFLVTLYGYMQLTGHNLVNWGRSVLVSSFGNKNFFAGFLVLTIPTVLGFLAATTKWSVRLVLGGLLLGEVFMILQTGTRTGFLGMLAGLSIVGFLFFRFVWVQQTRQRKLVQIGIVLVLLLVASFVAYDTAAGDLFQRLGRAFDLHRGTGRVRWIMWTGSSRAALDRPVTGHGHGVFQLVFPNYRPTFYHRFRVSHNTRHSHNEYMEVMMENGVVGLSLYLLIFVLLGLAVYRFLGRNRSRFYKYLVMGLTGSLAGALAQNFASVNLRWMSSTFTFWLTMGVLMATIRVACGAGGEEKAVDRRLRRSLKVLPPVSWKTAFHAVVLVMLVALGWNFYTLYRADRGLQRMNALINQAGRDDRYWALAEEWGEWSLRKNPYNLSTRYKLGYVYLSQGKFEDAEFAYTRLTNLAPNYAQIHNNIALIHRRFNEPYRKLLHFEWATWLEDNLRNHINLTGLYLRTSSSDRDPNDVERSAWHGLRVAWIFSENELNNVHVMSSRLAEQNYQGAAARIAVRKRHRSILNRALRLNTRTLPDGPNQLVSLWLSLRNPLQREAQRLKESKEPPSGLEFLSLVRRLRGRSGDRVRALRSSFTKLGLGWVQSGQTTALHRLALADLLVQIDRTDLARQLLPTAEADWRASPLLMESVSYVKNAASS